MNFGFRRKQGYAPSLDMLTHVRLPNSDNILDTESTETDEALLDIGYSLPLSAHPVVGTGGWFSDADTPITRLMSEILVDASVNATGGFVFAAARKGVTVYSVAQTGTALAKLSRYFSFEV